MTDDEIEKLVEEKARALIAAEKQREANDKAQAQREEQAAEKEKQRKADVTELAWQKAKAEENEVKPRNVWFISKSVTIIFAVVALVIGGIVFPACVEPIAGKSVFAAKFFCPSVCATCRGPGRVFTWHENSASYEGNVSRQICHNDDIDIDKLTWMNVTDEKKLDGYQLTLWSSVPVDWALVFVFLCVLGPFLVAKIRNNALNSDLVVRGQKIAELEQKLGPEAGTTKPYR